MLESSMPYLHESSVQFISVDGKNLRFRPVTTNGAI